MTSIVKIGIYTLEAFFACGVVGSVIVLLLSMVEDVEVWLTRDASKETNTEQLSSHPNFSTT